jgi:hypothetical protein
VGEEDTAKTSDSKDRARNERLAKALRENLKRRKTQTRNRSEEMRPATPGARAPFDQDSK